LSITTALSVIGTAESIKASGKDITLVAFNLGDYSVHLEAPTAASNPAQGSLSWQEQEPGFDIGAQPFTSPPALAFSQLARVRVACGFSHFD
jgi:hypothetical protein